jgi:hypothetical protein
VTHNMKRNLILTVCSAVFSMLPLAATPTPPACTADTLSAYIALGSGGCTNGDKIFSNFGYNGGLGTGGAANVTAAQVTVTPVGDLADNNLGVDFNGGWIAEAGQSIDSLIFFNVSVVGGGPMLIEDAGLGQLSVARGTGIATVAEDGCGPTPCTVSSEEWGLLTLDDATTTQRLDHTFFTPTGSIAVAKDVFVSGGADGMVHLSQVIDTFSQTAVPEPKSLSLLLGLGLVLGGVFRKKFQSARS